MPELIRMRFSWLIMHIRIPTRALAIEKCWQHSRISTVELLPLAKREYCVPVG
jgi:hypothetical protein